MTTPDIFSGQRGPADGVRLRHAIVAIALCASALIVYETTFVCTPRLFMYPRAGLSFFDVQDSTVALRGRPHELEMCKHLLYTPLGHAIYAVSNRMRILMGIRRECVALTFVNALYGSISVAFAYAIFLRLIGHARRAATAAALYAFSYSIWLMAGLTESYGLTALFVNTLLYVAIRKNTESSWIWSCGMIALIVLCTLCDLRSLLLLVIPFYVISRCRGIAWGARLGFASFVVVSTVLLVAVTYQSAAWISGRHCFSVSAMCKWLPGYGREFLSDKWALGRSRSPLYTLFTFTLQSLSPLFQEQFAQAPRFVQRLHLFFACGFLALCALLTATSLRSIAGQLRRWVSLQGVGCWLIAYFAYHVFYSPWSAILFSPPMVLPLLLIALPGIADTWAHRRRGAWVLALAAAMMLANNLLAINEARLAWQRPALAQSADDRIYLLPGEIERGWYLARAMLSRCPPEERDRLIALKARAYQPLSAREGRELDALTRKALGRLSAAERTQLDDIAHRHREAIRLSRGVQ